MNKLTTFLSGVALAALPSASAMASDLTFSFTGSTFSASGTMSYVPTGTVDQFLVTSGTGTINYGGTNYALNLLPVNGFAQNDNLFFAPPNKPFDFNGVAFQLATTTANIGLSLYNVPPVDTTDYELLGYIAGSQLASETSTLTVTMVPPGTVTPEPASLALFGTGALGLLGIMRRKLAV